MNQFAFEEPESKAIESGGAQQETPQEVPTMASKWKKASARWARETGMSYFSNPAARRDFRVQFRGNRSTWLFGAYLTVLVAMSLFEYWKVQNLDPFAVQDELRLFAGLILGSLGVLICLIAPAMAASSIISEKQRKSLDLVFCAPVRPRLYLIGKIISTYRYTWILLALSLPFSALSIMMGGGTWLEVICAYLLLSLQGVMLTSIGVFFSSLVDKAITALLYTYMAVVGYSVGLIMLVAMIFANSGAGGPGGDPGPLASFILSLSPLGPLLAITERFGGNPILNVLLAIPFTFFVSRVVLTSAGSMLTPLRPAERANLRLSAAVGMAALAGMVASQVHVPLIPADPSVVIPVVALLLFPFMPFLACYGMDGETRSRPNGLFALRKTLTGTPAGALPYSWLVVTLSTIGIGIGAQATGHFSVGLLGGFWFYGLGIATLLWSTARLASSYLVGLRASRALQFMILLAVLGLPVMLLGAVAGQGYEGFINQFPWSLWPFQPIFGTPTLLSLFLHGLIFWIAGGALASWSQRNLASRLMRRRSKALAEEKATAQAV